jgi:hypothetical protein
MHVEFQSGNLKGRDKLGGINVGGRIILWHICPKQEQLSHRNLERHATIELCLRRMNVCCSLLDNARNNEFAAVSAATVDMK